VPSTAARWRTIKRPSGKGEKLPFTSVCCQYSPYLLRISFDPIYRRNIEEESKQYRRKIEGNLANFSFLTAYKAYTTRATPQAPGRGLKTTILPALFFKSLKIHFIKNYNLEV